MSARRLVPVLGLCGLAVACTSVMQREPAEPSPAQVKAVLASSFQAKGQAKLDRLDQDELQKACSHAGEKPLSP